jgi:thiamine-phosphate pyrophosphorylase
MIPKLHYISKAITKKEQLEHIQIACSSGAELVQLNMEAVVDKDRLSLAEEARTITAHFQTRLIIKTYHKIAKQIKADGLYFDDIAASPASVRDHLYSWQTLGATAHTLEECNVCIASDLDYIGLGPFRIPAAQGNQALGIKGYTAITKALDTETPIIGFGNITTGDVTGILETGVSGIAVSNEITRDFNSIKVFHNLLNASATKEQRHSFTEPEA